MDAETYLESLLPTKKAIDHFVSAESGGTTFDADLGWLLHDDIRRNGVDGSKGYYHYEKNGARRIINSADKPSRIHAYGNSFTHCDQVSDGETWEEYLAAHLQEPIHNYGIGGYSVYQAYLRMVRTEQQEGAEYVILNIFDDDHYRNLDTWRAIRLGVSNPCTIPHLTVNVDQDSYEFVENLCRTHHDVLKLCDRDFLLQSFANDLRLRVMMARRAISNRSPEIKEFGTESRDRPPAQDRGGVEVSRDFVDRLAGELGISTSRVPDAQVAVQGEWVYTEAALYATRCVLNLVEEFVKEAGKKLLVLLSFSSPRMAEDLAGKPRFDQSFLDWARERDYPIIDFRDSFRRDYTLQKADIQTYLGRFYIGHHTPAGNFFSAWAMKDQICRWLDPPPIPYR